MPFWDRQVVRGDDLLPAAATQAFLAELLGYPTPIYAHVPLAVKRRETAVRRRRGRALGRWTWHRLANVSPDALLERFDPALLPREPWVVVPSRGLRSGT